MAAIRFMPMLGIIWVIYNIMLLVSDIGSTLGNEVFSVSLLSGATWSTTVGELLIMVGVLALYIEMFKATRTTTSSIIDHGISMLVFIAYLIEFLMVSGAGNSIFMILMLMALVDVIAGYTITIVAARRDLGFGNNPNI
ncbi:MAG: hypothetical protein AAF420_10650 [Pseudomonadota bacterium]